MVEAQRDEECSGRLWLKVGVVKGRKLAGSCRLLPSHYSNAIFFMVGPICMRVLLCSFAPEDGEKRGQCQCNTRQCKRWLSDFVTRALIKASRGAELISPCVEY